LANPVTLVYLPIYGKDCQSIAQGLPKYRPRNAKGLPKDCQSIAQGLPKCRSRIAKGLALFGYFQFSCVYFTAFWAK
jgi:hypothetical protein